MHTKTQSSVRKVSVHLNQKEIAQNVLKGNDQITEEQLLRELLPQGIVCMESALFHYGYSDFAPRAWSVAVPRTASRTVGNIGEFPVRAYYIQKEYFSIGKTVESFNGVMLPTYDHLLPYGL